MLNNWTSKRSIEICTSAVGEIDSKSGNKARAMELTID